MSEVLKNFSANIDLKQSLVNEDVKVVEGDNGNVLVLNIVKDGLPVDLTDCIVLLVFAHSGRTVWQDSSSPDGGITISGTDNNIVTVRLHSDSYAPNGITVCQVQVYSGTSNTTLVSSARFSFKSELSLLNAETVESIEQYSILVTLIESVTSVLDGAQADWNETNTLLKSFIKNKPVVGTDIQDATQNLTAETTLSDTDTVPFYDASATAHRKTTWSNIVAKIRTLLFGSFTGLAKLDGAGNVTAGVANTDFAAATHASRHAYGAPDAVSPTAIKAVSYGGAQTIADADQAQARTNISAAKAVSGIADAMEARVPIDSYTDSITISASNVGRDAHVSSASNKTVTFPSLTEGYYGFITRDGTGTLTMVAGSGVTLRAAGNRLKVAEQYNKVYFGYIDSVTVELIGSFSL